MLIEKISIGSAPTLCQIDGQSINVSNMSSAIEIAFERARRNIGFTFYTLNLDHLCKRRKSRAFSDCYNRATFVSADGAPLIWLARSVGSKIERTTGADMVMPMAAQAAREGVSIFLFGSTDDVLHKTAGVLKRAYPTLRIAGMEAPPMGFEPTSQAALDAADRIAASGAGLCFIALGAPKQELFADAVYQRHSNLGLFCVGAALDFIAGTQERAPQFMSRNGLEWLWRLSQDPKRLTGRYLDSAQMLVRLYFTTRPYPVVNPKQGPKSGPTSKHVPPKPESTLLCEELDMNPTNAIAVQYRMAWINTWPKDRHI